MIMYYDVMLVDDDPVVHRAHRERRKLLETLVSPIKGRAEIVWQKHVRFDRPTGPEKLKKALALAFVQRWEGLVLKPSDESYFNLGKSVKRSFPSRWIKLKKDCIKGLGDTADFAVVGAGYDVNEAEKYQGINIRWTHFYIGCLRNKAAVLHAGEKPRFFVFEQIKDGIRREDMKKLTENGCLRAMSTEFPETWEVFDIELARGLPSMSVIFRKPFVFDIAGSGFDKSPNRDIFTLRFPRVMKVHFDRNWNESVDLEELQQMATEARTVPTGDIFVGVAEWIEKLNDIDRGARGEQTSWDLTDDEEDEYYLSTPDVEASKPKAVRRSRGSAAPPLVRMDTEEMQDQERRLSDGTVVERPTPKHSKGSLTSAGTLQTPPKSLLLSGRSGATSNHKAHMINSEDLRESRKRKVECDDASESVRNTKKPRPLLIQHSDREPSHINKVCPPNLKEPLHDITNSARPSLSARSTIPSQLKQRSTLGLSLVRKTAVGTDEHLRRRNNTTRICVEPSSPTRETTASQTTSGDTTQQSVSEGSLSALLLPVDATKASFPGLPTPPSTAELASSMEIPNIRECDVMLSPCLLDPDHNVNKLLLDHRKTALSFPDSPPADDSSPGFKSKPRYEVVMLVDSNNTNAVGGQIGVLLHHIRHWHPRVVTLWDWRLLEYKSPQPMEERHKEMLIHKFFVAKLWWDPLAKGEGAVVLKWCSGKPTLVLKEELDQMQWVECI